MSAENFTVSVIEVRRELSGDVIYYDNHILRGKAFTGVTGCKIEKQNLLTILDLGTAFSMLSCYACTLCNLKPNCFAIPLSVASEEPPQKP